MRKNLESLFTNISASHEKQPTAKSNTTAHATALPTRGSIATYGIGMAKTATVSANL
jgi:hypothetical protein